MGEGERRQGMREKIFSKTFLHTIVDVKIFEKAKFRTYKCTKRQAAILKKKH